MKRRELLKGMLSAPAIAIISGYAAGFQRRASHAQPSKITTLRVILQGPFALVMQKDQGYRIKAFVPYDREGQHEFRFRTPMDVVTPAKHSCQVRHEFSLSEHGLHTTSTRPYIDHGFDDALLSVDQWRPKPEDYFVALDLPAPRTIGYLPPLYPVQFESRGNHESAYARMPLNLILEYAVVDADDIWMSRFLLERCSKDKDKNKHNDKDEGRDRDNDNDNEHLKKLKDEHPLSCEDLYTRYEEYWKKHDDPDPDYSQRPHAKLEYGSCSFGTYFFGVGLPPGSDYAMHLMDHGVDFYNNKLLPAFYGDQPIPDGRTLKYVGKRAVRPCDMGASGALAPGMRPAVWHDSMPQPHIEYVTSGENCTSPAAPGTASTTLPPTPSHP